MAFLGRRVGRWPASCIGSTLRRASRLSTAIAIAAVATSLVAQVKVVTTTPDLADVARSIGGDDIDVRSLTTGEEDLHLVTVRPSFLVQVHRADVFVQLGFDAEHAWVPALLQKAKNRAVRPGGAGFCDASVGVTPLQVPASVTRDAGPDLHPRGNPHYNLDPRRMKIVARNVRDCLVRVDKEHRDAYIERHAAFDAAIEHRLAQWTKLLAPCRGSAFIENHRTWVYFADAFDLKIVGSLEPRPGLPPSAKHLANIIELAKREKVRLVVARPRFAELARRVAKDCGAEARILQIGSLASGRGWLAFMDDIVAQFASVLGPDGSRR
ncbi:MAG: zinc ABC transporter substrate-binding protein [Planctomycetes bacterium]|nr:zinc ABC transporter substrate-binding protein [Planctomycetota bacterium]